MTPIQVRTESQLLADAGVPKAAVKAQILFCVGVRQQEAVAALRDVAPPEVVQLAFDSDAGLEASSRLQV